MKRYLIFLLFILNSAALQANPLTTQANSLKEYREVRYVMGTLLDITLYHHDAQEARYFLDEAFSLAQRLDALLSNYKPQSELNRLNQKAGHGRVKVSADLYEFLGLTKVLAEKTQEAFDISVGPLMGLWEEAQKKRAPPSSSSLSDALRSVGMHKVVLYRNLEVELTQKGMILDTGGIGKGYAVDQIAALFKRLRIISALINFGQSSIRAIGPPPQKHTWELLLQFPDQRPLGLLELKDQALSASDTFGRSFEVGGRKYGHIVDPKSGIPISQRVQAVVLGPSATEAEALSKYVILRGWKKRGDLKTWGKVRIMRILENEGIQRTEDFPVRFQIGPGHSS